MSIRPLQIEPSDSGFWNKEVSISSITALSLIFYFPYTVVTAKLIYLQFSLLEVVKVSMVFLGIMVFLTIIFFRIDKQLSLKVNYKNLGAAAFVFFVLAMLSNILHPQIDSYPHPLILLETELGLGWNHDTAYNVSLIQSILNYGYPSTAQHGHPFRFYHALSHYVDALILLIARIDPYDSYGLLFHFKFSAFLSSIVIAVSAITQREKVSVYLISIILLTPLIVGNGLAIGSHSQWFASILTLMSAPFLYSTIYRDGSVPVPRFLAIFAIIVAIALAKVSSSLMLASLIGAFVLAKGFKNPSAYIFGMALLIFFYIYGTSFSPDNGISHQFSYSNLSLESLYHYYFGPALYPGGVKLTPGIVTMVLTLFAFYCLAANKITGSALFASIVGALGLYIVTAAVELTPAVIWHFQMGMTAALLLMTFTIVIKYQKIVRCKVGGILLLTIDSRVTKPATDAVLKFLRNAIDVVLKKLIFFWVALLMHNKFAISEKIVTVAIVLSLAMLSNNFIKPSYNVFNAGFSSIIEGFHHVNESRFSGINDKLSPELQLSISRIYLRGLSDIKNRALEQLSTTRPLYDLRQQLTDAISAEGIDKKRVALFIPKEIFDDSAKIFGAQYEVVGDQDWDLGLLFYAVTGVQLVSSVGSIPNGWGFDRYANNASSFRVNSADFSLDKTCNILDISHVAILSQLSPPKIKIVPCKR